MSALLTTPGPWTRGATFLGLLTIAAGFGFFHAVIGEEISFSLFYLLPVAGATWFVGRSAGLIMAAFCGIVALGADLAIGREYSQAWIPVYNALVVCGFFIIAAYALAHLRKALEEEGRLAREDVLTSIPNLRSFQEQFPNRLRSAGKSKAAVTLGLVDLSDLTYINDRWGRPAGDLLLRVTATTLRRLLRPEDLLWRVGGTTFAVIFPGVSYAEAQDLLDRVRTGVLAEMEGYDRPISIAIAAVTVDHPTEDGDRLFEQAASVLRNIKEKGTAPHPFKVEREAVR